MSLSSLPPEVKLHIIEHLDPIPALHFALACKQHLDLVKKHLELFARYHTIKPSSDGFCIWDLTKEILQDPRKGWYVRELNLVADRPECHENLPEEDKALFKAAAEKILPLYCHESSFFVEKGPLDDLQQSLSRLDVWTEEAAVLVLLLHHVPELRIFRMTDTSTHDSLQAFMRRVAEGYQNPALAAKMPLQQLRTAAIAHYDTEFSCDIDWAVYFMCVPSLRTFAAFMMGSEDAGQFYTGEDDGIHDDPSGVSYLRNTATTPVSNVEELVFTQCQFDPQSFNTLLPMIKNLKSFSYDAGGSIVSYADYHGRKVIKALANHASHSLEELELTECETGFEVRLTPYTTLRVERANNRIPKER
ncbi:hypothetical protein E8E13_003064 [Curvularia kusanoi]|uniref:F-box domain-containing protein n=1 Tax=Curvularia kusanoi TaxID=90978 RepID=A0A9P4TB71_CURKU|nr:hypothetical protein E8E13_003064 [Curvularia kusanoi]